MINWGPLWLVVPLAACAGLGGAFWVGHHYGSQGKELACLKAAQKAQAASTEQTVSIESARVLVEQDGSAAHSTLGEVQAVQTREVIRYVQTRPTSDCRLDPDGLRLWNAANAGTDPTQSAAASAGAVSSNVAASDVGHRAGNGRQPHRVGADVSPVPPAASSAGALGGG